VKTINNRDELDTYLELIREMPLKSIINDRHLKSAQKMISSLLSRKLDSGAEDYLGALTDLVEKYESDFHDFGTATASQVLKFLMQDRDLNQSQVASGAEIPKSMISEVLNGKRSVTIDVAKKLGLFFAIAPSIFIDCSS
jgi:HTH-type transcriptional regulator / antitoxin HigA